MNLGFSKNTYYYDNNLLSKLLNHIEMQYVVSNGKSSGKLNGEVMVRIYYDDRTSLASAPFIAVILLNLTLKVKEIRNYFLIRG